MSTYPEEFKRLEEENTELKSDFETIEQMYNALKPVNAHLERENERLKGALENIKINETRVMKGFGEMFNSKKQFKGKSTSYILAEQALQEKLK